MDIRQLREFVDLVQTCNFQETAENLNTSQPCISKHIHKLEEELGVKLFDRTSRNVTLNEYGTSFAVYARKITDLSDAALSELNELRRNSNNSLSVGFHPILGQYGLVELISQFSEANPEISMNIIESSNPEEMLKTLQCDVVFAPEDELVSPNIQRILYMRDSLAVVFPSSHPFAKAEAVTLAQLRDEDFIAHSRSQGDLQNESVNFSRICNESGFTPHVVATVSRTATIVKFVSQGRGIALLFRKHVPTDITGITIVNLSPEIPVNICVFYLKKRNLPNAVSTFLHYMKSISSDAE